MSMIDWRVEDAMKGMGGKPQDILKRATAYDRVRQGLKSFGPSGSPPRLQRA